MYVSMYMAKPPNQVILLTCTMEAMQFNGTTGTCTVKTAHNAKVVLFMKSLSELVRHCSRGLLVIYTPGSAFDVAWLLWYKHSWITSIIP